MPDISPSPRQRSAEQGAFVPPSAPSQDQLQGPEPLSAEDVPVIQRPALATSVAVAKERPFAPPQRPFTGTAEDVAVQGAFVPPPDPEQVQLHGPLPETFGEVPAAQSPALLTSVAEAKDPPAAPPQLPFTGTKDKVAEQGALVPPPDPEQVQLQGPSPVKAGALPALQSWAAFTSEASAKAPPSAPPQAPLIGPAQVSHPGTVRFPPQPSLTVPREVLQTPGAQLGAEGVQQLS